MNVGVAVVYVGTATITGRRLWAVKFTGGCRTCLYTRLELSPRQGIPATDIKENFLPSRRQMQLPRGCR